ncbi:MAG TPA: M1 family metallopeptidase, partial [Polyangiaceae bacterium]|nr:M1 family metallopeptidase [Polyangiaceae bacterium]
MRWLWMALLFACGPSGDLTMAPPRDARRITVTGIAPPRDDGRLPDLAQPRRYRLRLDIDPAAPRFRGETIIDVVLPRATRAVVMHGSELSISRAEFVVGADRVRADASFRKAAGAKRDAEELVLVSAAELPAGDVQIHIEYTAPLNESLRGVYRVREGGKTYVFTQFEPSDARRMFPCFDDPIYKVPFEVEVRVPKGNVVYSNAAETNRTAEEKSVVFAFAPSKPMPTYLVALAIGPLEAREGAREPVPIRLLAVEGKSKLGEVALKTAADHLELLSEYFGRPYPYDKLDLVAVPNFGPGAMENAGLITFREELLLLDSGTTSAKARRDLAMILSHELAHQWFGNLVTMQWWDDLWLNEGFATYMETLIVDRWQPSMRAGLEMLSMSGWVMELDALDAARAVRQPVSNTYQAEEAFDAITYVKGASVLRMLHRWMGDEAFRQGVRGYMSEHAWGNARAADLFRTLSKAAKQDVASVASTFLDQPGVPLVRATLACQEGKRPVVKLTQQRYRARPAADDRGTSWNIPVCVAFDKGGARDDRECTLLT